MDNRLLIIIFINNLCILIITIVNSIKR
uniref:Uncharacterized protein n=1 Tax=Rhizophora mucronata TaxID=61149 RepID=A0A2P2NTF5_RHIMU